MIKLKIILLLLLTSSLTIFSQEGIKKEEWQKATKKYDYTETYKEPKEKPSEEIEIPKEETQKNMGVSPIIKILPIILLVAVITILVVVLVNNPASFRPTTRVINKEKLTEVDDPDEYHVSDLERYLAEALRAGDFRLAVRIQFLMLIKKLQDNAIIQWRKEKTNIDYLGEVKTDIRPSFAYIVRVFEKIWYASYHISENHYQGLVPRFDELKAKIRR